MVHYFSVRFSLLAVVCTALLSCSQYLHSALDSQVGPTYMVHEVKFRGETLSVISRWYTGSAENWTIIRERNPSIDPRSLKLGDRIGIPLEIVKNRLPLPKTIVALNLSARGSQSGLKQKGESDQVTQFASDTTDDDLSLDQADMPGAPNPPSSDVQIEQEKKDELIKAVIE